jgi:poly-gamma-glutamate synthesis protein (capsule biosynthesis protein)
MLQIANSYTINNGMIGLEQTLSAIKRANLEPLGAYATPEDAQQTGGFALRDISGIKVAFVAFTKGMDSMRLPDGKENCVNLLYEDYTSTYQHINTEGITNILKNVAAAQPDLTVALLHWGSEYNTQVSASQQKIVNLMQENGVDAIIGTHSHYVQEIEFDKQSGQLVAYSLGDLLGDADKSRAAYSIALNIEIKKNHITGKTAISSFDYTPIYIDNQVSEDGDISTRLLRIPPAIEEYETNGITKVSEEDYLAMKSAVTRLQKLLSDTRKLSERKE